MLDVTRADLSTHTTLRLGGPARQLVTAGDEAELVAAVRAAQPAVIIAGGSNVVIADDGVPATVILVRSAGIELVRDSDHALITVQAGQSWDDVVRFALAEGLAGIECLSGIPGSAGATPIQNVGAYGQEVAGTIERVRVFDRHTGTVVDLAAPECGFAYRHSVFKHNPRYVVLATTFRLGRSALSTPIRYAELARTLGLAAGDRAPLAEVREAVLGLRRGKGMVLDPDDPDTCSVGSFFVNPVLDPAGFSTLDARCRATHGSAPAAWPAPDGSVKVSAAWLIERAGFGKGYHGGHTGVSISTKHTLALTNRGGGTTSALLDLAREIRDGVWHRFGVRLRPEPVLVNCAL